MIDIKLQPKCPLYLHKNKMKMKIKRPTHRSKTNQIPNIKTNTKKLKEE
jgi:hypothetical protein